jgi:uncharacterized protein
MYLLPQEIEVKYIIPAIRRDISKKLSEDYKISYDKIGKLLGITKSAVSQYLGMKRAAKIKLNPHIQKEISNACKRIIKKKSDSVREITRILRYIRNNDLYCEVCGKIINGVLHDCKQIIAKYDDCE